MTPYNDIFVLHQTGLNHSQIERKLGTVTRKTIISVLQLAEKYSFRYNPEDGLSDTDIHRILHPKKNKKDRMPNLDVCFYRLGLPDQSIAGLRSLYAEECARRGVTPYSRSMFQNIIAEERHRFNREYSPVMELLYAKDAVAESGKLFSFLFYRYCDSGYTSFTCVKDKKTRTWIHSVIRAIKDIDVSVDTFRYLGRIPSKVRGETADCVSFYGMRLEETGKEKEKSDDFRQWVSETIRMINDDRSDTSRTLLLARACAAYNSRPFFNSDRFTVEDAHRIAVSESYPLPDRDYDLVEYTDVKPFINYHVKIDGRFYSVPFMFRHDRLTAYVSDRIIEIYHGNAIVAVHGVLGGSRGRYSTDPSHLPQDDEIPYGEVSGRSLRSWAGSIGPYTRAVVDRWLTSRQYEVQAYISCNALLHMADSYERSKIEEACKAAYENKEISYKSVIQRIKIFDML